MSVPSCASRALPKPEELALAFPMIGEVEMRYDEELGRVVYEPVSIEPNINVPRVIRK
jgi:NADH-quinone oxidoreductase subunit C